MISKEFSDRLFYEQDAIIFRFYDFENMCDMSVGDYYSLPTRERRIVRERTERDAKAHIEHMGLCRLDLVNFIERIEEAHRNAGRGRLRYRGCVEEAA